MDVTIKLFGLLLVRVRASAYDVFAPSVVGAAGGMGQPTSRRSSFRAIPPEPNAFGDVAPNPEHNDSALGVEEDRRLRRRGSQL